MTYEDEIMFAKLVAPRLDPLAISRPRLYQKLLSYLDRRLVLVTGPVGYGKSALLGEWYNLLSGEPDLFSVAWMSLDADDRDPALFWRSLLTSLSSIFPAIIKDNPVPSPEGDFSLFSRKVSNYLHMHCESKKYILLIDNFDILNGEEAGELFRFFLGQLPTECTVVAAGFLYVPDSLDILHRSTVFELPVGDLSFDKDETYRLLQKRTPKASRIHAAKIQAIAGGWPSVVGLYADAVENSVLTGDMLDKGSLYPLVDEFLMICLGQDFTKEMESFLVRTSIVEKINSSLACHISKADSSGIYIEMLVKRHILMDCSIDGERWFVYQPLMLWWLRRRLFQFRSGRVRQLSFLACEWFEKHGRVTDAAKYMLMASEPDLVESLAASAGFTRDDPSKPFAEWICEVPSQTFLSDATLSLFASWGYVSWGRGDDALQWLDVFHANYLTAAAAKDEDVPENERAVAVTMEHIRIKCREFEGCFHEAIVEYKKLLEGQDKNLSLSLRCMLTHALAESYERVGEFGKAKEQYLQTEALADLVGSPFLVAFNRYSLCWLQVMRGELKEAHEAAKKALKDCPADLSLVGAFHSLLAFIQVEMNELGKAEANLDAALAELSSSRNIDLLIEANTIKALHMAASGEVDGSYRLLVKTVMLAEGTDVPRGVPFFAHLIQARIALMLGSAQDAEEIHRTLDERIDQTDLFYFLRNEIIDARIKAVLGEKSEALAITEKTLLRAKEAHLGLLSLEALLFKVVLLSDLPGKAETISTLNDALLLAATQGRIQPFLFEGNHMRMLLHELTTLRKTDGLAYLFAKKVLKSFHELEPDSNETATPEITAAHLTKRECQVLELLNTGMSRHEIAESLHISHNTAKTHLNNIYGKLGVSKKLDVLRMVSAKETPPSE